MAKVVEFVDEVGQSEERNVMKVVFGERSVGFVVGTKGVCLREESVDRLIDLLLEWKYSRKLLDVASMLEVVKGKIDEMIEEVR